MCFAYYIRCSGLEHSRTDHITTRRLQDYILIYSVVANGALHLVDEGTKVNLLPV